MGQSKHIDVTCYYENEKLIDDDITPKDVLKNIEIVDRGTFKCKGCEKHLFFNKGSTKKGKGSPYFYMSSKNKHGNNCNYAFNADEILKQLVDRKMDNRFKIDVSHLIKGLINEDQKSIETVKQQNTYRKSALRYPTTSEGTTLHTLKDASRLRDLLDQTTDKDKHKVLLSLLGRDKLYFAAPNFLEVLLEQYKINNINHPIFVEACLHCRNYKDIEQKGYTILTDFPFFKDYGNVQIHLYFHAARKKVLLNRFKDITYAIKESQRKTGKIIALGYVRGYKENNKITYIQFEALDIVKRNK